MKKRVLSLFMALVLCFTMLPAAAFAETVDAAETPAGGNTAVISTPAEEDTAQEGDEEEPDADEADAAVQAAQTLIDALPNEVTADGAEEVEAQLAAIRAALDALTEAQLTGVDQTRYETVCAALAELAEPQENTPATLAEPQETVSVMAAANEADRPQGDGTESSPYLISKLEELKWFRDTVNGGETGICAKLTAKIKFDEKWEPIGTETNPYTGTFDGNGCEISIDYAAAPDGMTKGWGLFGYIGSAGKVQDLSVYVNYFGRNWKTLTVSESGMLAAYNAGIIERCTATNGRQFYVNGTVGLLVYQNGGTIQDCLAELGKNYESLGNIGGVAYQNNGSIRNCFFYCATYIGGAMNNHAIAIEKGTGSSITNCYHQYNYPTEDTTEGVKSLSSSDIRSGKLTVLLNNSGDATGSKTDPWRSDWNKYPSLKKTDSRVRYENGSYVIDSKPHMHGDVEFTKVTSLSDITGGGSYYIDSATTLNSTWTISADVSLCLNGQTITAGSGITAIEIQDGGSLTLVDCSKDGTGKLTGGKTGVLVGGGSFTMQAGEITGCTTGVSVQRGTITLSGKAKVIDNTTQNILLAQGQTIRFGELDASAKFGISAAGQNTLTDNGRVAVTDETGGQYFAQLVADGFKNDGTGFELYLSEDGKTVTLGKQIAHKHCICGGDTTNPGHTAHSDVTFLPWTGTDSLPREGNYYLTRNVTLNTAANLKSANICLNGYTVTSSKGKNIQAGAQGFNDRWGSLTDCTGKGTVTGNGTVYMQFGGTINLYGGTLDGTHVELAQSGGTFNMYGGKITNYRGSVGTVTGQNNTRVFINLYGGEISGNNSSEESGGVWIGAGNQFKMYGGTIRNNTGAKAGGVGFASANTTYQVGTMTVSGSAVIQNNTVNDTTNNVYLPGGKTLQISGQLNGAKIGVSVSSLPKEGSQVTIATGSTLTDADSACFTPDAGGVYRITPDAAGTTLNLGMPPHEHPVSTGGEKVTWLPVGSASALRALTAGKYYLTDNITLSDTSWSPVNGVTLDLNSHSITASGAFDAITVGDGVTFTLTDCKGGSETANYGSITHSMQGANKYPGRGVTVSANGHFVMLGGSINGNVAVSSVGAGVYVAEGASFTMSGGEIVNNIVSGMTQNGGGIWTAGNTTIGGSAKITGNKARSGGGVCVSGGTLTLRDNAEITVNTANNTKGSGIFVDTAGTLNVSGSVRVTGNQYNTLFSNVYLAADGSNTITPIRVAGALTSSASIGVSVPDTVRNTITDNNHITIAATDTEGWIKDGSFTLDGWTAYTIYVTDSGKTVWLGTHTHDWVYTESPDGTTLTAKCSTTGCTSEGGSVTIKEPAADTLTYDGSPKAATLEGAFNTGVAPTIAYQKKEERTFTDFADTPTDAGLYKASITAGSATASVTYRIAQASLTAEDFNFTPPENLVYDGNDKTATITSRKTGVGDITVTYWAQEGGWAPYTGNVGTYVVRIRVDASTNYLPIPDSITGENWTFTVTPTDQWQVNVPESWNTPTEVIEGSTYGAALNIITKYYSDNATATGVKNTNLFGTVNWFTDAGCTTPVDETAPLNGTAGSTGKLYWKFTFSDPQDNANYTPNTKTGSVDFKIVDGPQQGVVFIDGRSHGIVTAETVEYSSNNKSFPLSVQNLTTDGGQITITNSDPSVATYDAEQELLTIHKAGATTITATAAMVPGQYAKTAATYTLTVEKGTRSDGINMQSYFYNATPNTPYRYNHDESDNGAVTYYYSATKAAVGSKEWQVWDISNPPALDVGTYYMYAVVAESENYLAHTTTIIDFEVRKDWPTCASPTGVTAAYGQTLGDIQLTNPAGNTPGTWSWMNNSESVGDVSATAKIFMAKFTPTDTAHYEIFTNIEVEVLVIQADQQALKVTGGTTVVYGQKLALGTSGGSGTGTVTYTVTTVTNGTGEATIDPVTGVLTPVKVGSVTVTATKAGDVNYNEAASAPVEITITKATPAGEPKYTKINGRGKTLADAALSLLGGTLNLTSGTLEWVDENGNVLSDTTTVAANKVYTWRFTPTDGNYTVLTGSVVLYAVSSSGGGFRPAHSNRGDRHTITAIAGANGAISPSGDNAIRTGGQQTFTITPDEGYAVAKVLIDGKSVGAVTSYTFQDVTEAHTIRVIFMKANGNPQTGVSADTPARAAAGGR